MNKYWIKCIDKDYLDGRNVHAFLKYLVTAVILFQ